MLSFIRLVATIAVMMLLGFAFGATVGHLAFGKANKYHPNDYEFSFMVRNWYIASQ